LPSPLLADYDNTFRRFEAFLGADRPLARIAPADIRHFLNNHNGLSGKTVRNYHTSLSAFWQDIQNMLIACERSRASELCNLCIRDLDVKSICHSFITSSSRRLSSRSTTLEAG
jgi:hypothetical protein